MIRVPLRWRWSSRFDDGTISLLPDCVLVEQLVRQPLGAQDLRMHPNDQHFLVIGPIEDADAAAFGQTSGWCATESRAPVPRHSGV